MAPRVGKDTSPSSRRASSGQELLAAAKLDTENYATYYYLGKISRMTGDRSRALTMFDKALNDGELRQRSYLEKANIFVAEKAYEVVSPLVFEIQLNIVVFPVLVIPNIPHCKAIYYAFKDFQITKVLKWNNAYTIKHSIMKFYFYKFDKLKIT